MDRRRFLKYAGSAAIAIGASALGLDYISELRSVTQTPSSTLSLTTASATTSTSILTTDLQLSLFADWHGDGKQQSDEPTINDVPVEINGIDTDYKAVLVADSDGKYWARNIPVGKRYRIVPKTDKYRYVALSNAEFQPINESYPPLQYSYIVPSNEASLQLGLMEGFLTLPMSSKTHYEIDRFYDHDPDPSTYLWWNGRRGPDQRKYSDGDYRGYSPNHTGIDYYMPEGSPLPSPAPGKVWAVGEATGCPDWRVCDEGEKYVNILHPNGFITSCNHISKASVNLGESVLRGQIIALSGKSGKNTELANYPHNHFGFSYKGLMIIDPYKPVFNMVPQFSGYYDASNGNWVPTPISSDPNMSNHWTKDNDPQYSAT